MGGVGRGGWVRGAGFGSDLGFGLQESGGGERDVANLWIQLCRAFKSIEKEPTEKNRSGGWGGGGNQNGFTLCLGWLQGGLWWVNVVFKLGLGWA